MNLREAYAALVEGKKVRSANWDEDEFVVFAVDGERLYDEGGFDYDLDSYDGPFEMYIEPNLHPKGTFAWAREEVERGQVVKRSKTSAKYANANYGNTFSFRECVFTLEDFDATDWEIA